MSAVLVKRRLTTSADSIADFDPTTISGCVTWLKADRGVTLGTGQYVAAWADQSGGAHHWSQPTAAVQSTLVTRSLNGRPAIRSDNSNGGNLQYLIGPSYASILASGGEVFIAYKTDVATQHGLHHMAASGVNNALLYASQLYDNWGSTTSRFSPPATTIPDGTVHVYNVTSVAGEWTSRFDGVQYATSATNTVGWDSGGSLLLATSTSGYASPTAATYFLGVMAEIIIYSRKLTTTERATVTSNLLRQYTFGPSTIAGCALWLEASKGVTLGTGTSVAFWADQSGHARNFQQSDTSKQPTLVASGINSLPSIAFAAASSQFLTGPTLASLPNACDIWIVFKRNSSAGDLGLWHFGSSANESKITSGGVITDNTASANTAYTASASANTGPNVFNAYANVSTLVNRLNNTVVAAPAASTNTYGFDGAGSMLGATSTGGLTPSKYFDGQIIHVIAYDNKLSDATDRTLVYQELKAKYGTP